MPDLGALERAVDSNRGKWVIAEWFANIVWVSARAERFGREEDKREEVGR